MLPESSSSLDHWGIQSCTTCVCEGLNSRNVFTEKDAYLVYLVCALPNGVLITVR